MTIVMPISENTAPSKASATLKCDATPRHDWSVINPVSMTLPITNGIVNPQPNRGR